MRIIMLVTLYLCAGMAGASDWFDQLDAPLRITYRVEFHSSMSDADFAALARRVRERPEHPDRLEYEYELERRAQGPTVVTHQAWLDDRGVHRANTTNSDGVGYADVARDGGTGWSLTATGLTLVNASDERGPGEVDPVSMLDEEAHQLGRLFTRGCTLLERVGFSEDMWVAVDGGYVIEGDSFTVRLVDDGETVEITITQAQQPGVVGTRWVLDGTIEAGGTGLHLPKTLSSYTAQGDLDQRMVLERVERISTDELEAVTRIPRVDQNDAVRGELTFTMIQDNRSGDLVQTTLNEGGETRVERFETGESRGWVRPVLWVVAGLIVIALVVLRVRRGS